MKQLMLKMPENKRSQHKAPTQVILEDTVDYPAFITEGNFEYF